MTAAGRGRRWVALAVVACATLGVTGAAQAQAADTVGVIAEIKAGRGRVEVSRAGGDWRPAGPLAALRAGDRVRATADARAVVLLTAGRGAVAVSAATSPYTAPAPPAGAGTLDRARSLVEAGVGYLASRPVEAPRAVLAVRGIARPPVVIGPRNGPVLPRGLAFEWMGTAFSRYTVRVVGPAGPVLERSGVSGGRLDYPADAPALVPGVRYTIQVRMAAQAPEEAWFEVVEAARAEAVERDLAALKQSLAGRASATSVALLEAAVLAERGLLHDARRVVLAALATDPDEPALHRLLGDLYVRAGLPELGAESFDEAEFLLHRSPAETPRVPRE